MADASLTDPPSAMRYPLPRGCPKKHPVGRTVPGEPPLSYENANVGSAGTPRPTFRHAPGTDSPYSLSFFSGAGGGGAGGAGGDGGFGSVTGFGAAVAGFGAAVAGFGAGVGLIGGVTTEVSSFFGSSFFPA